MKTRYAKSLFATLLGATLALPVMAAPGISEDEIRVGSVLDLEGDSKRLGLGIKAGLEAAFANSKVGGRSVRLVAANDFYDPSTTKGETAKLIESGIFAMIGNVGTPTAAASLPLLDAADVPAVGFFTGAGLLRPGSGQIINYRASYVQETAAVIKTALGAGVSANEICAFVQNDGYGMAGVAGINQALSESGADSNLIDLISAIKALEGVNPERNHHGPIGVYNRNTLNVAAGYQSLKNWERTSGTRCRLVVSVGTYAAVGRFIAYSRLQGESWLYSAVSFTGATPLQNLLAEYNIRNGVIVSQVVPRLDSSLPIVAEAREALGSQLSYVSLEGYIVGKMFIHLMSQIEGELTVEKFAAAAAGNTFEIGGVVLDFRDDNQGSDLVSMIYLADDDFRVISSDELMSLLNS